jgi:hypothetical protein
MAHFILICHFSVFLLLLNSPVELLFQYVCQQFRDESYRKAELVREPNRWDKFPAGKVAV